MAVNDAPTGSSKTIELEPDDTWAFGLLDWGFNDTNGHNLLSVIVESLPGSGTLKYNNEPVTVGMEIPFDELFYDTDENATGIHSFTFRVKDDGGTAGGGSDTSAAAYTFSVDFGGASGLPPTDISGSLSVNEGSANGTLAGVLTATDADSSSFTWSLLDSAGGRFSIDAATGEVSVANRYRLDHEQAASHVITVEVSDGASTYSEDVTVTIGNVYPENMTGNNSANKFVGGAGNDSFKGGGGNDTIEGGGGRDRLAGGKGNDTVKGGGGVDQFVFDAALGASNIDRVVDFKHNTDRLLLDGGIFDGIGVRLDAREFLAKSGATKAADSNDRIIYDTNTGKLYLDADGKGGDASIHFATLANKPAGLDAGDFAIV
jgi:Ca2+-binding RTX toxin-like protein